MSRTRRWRAWFGCFKASAEAAPFCGDNAEEHRALPAGSKAPDSHAPDECGASFPGERRGEEERRDKICRFVAAGARNTVTIDAAQPDTPLAALAGYLPLNSSEQRRRPEFAPVASRSARASWRIATPSEHEEDAAKSSRSSLDLGGVAAPPLQLSLLPVDSSLATMLAAVAATTWVGRGAQGAVLQAQWRAGATVAVKWLVTDAVDAPAAYMEALVAKMLAHPYVVQTFEYAVAAVDESFLQIAGGAPPSSFALAAPSPASARAAPAPCALSPFVASLLESNDIVDIPHVDDTLEVAPLLDSFEGPQAARPGPRAVDCVEMLRELGAAPGKYVVQIISEWCDEGTLHAAIRRGVFRAHGRRSHTWALRALLRTAREVALGMCHLHSLNIIHGDLKPGNVLLKSSRMDSRGFVAKVADFGLSRVCGKHDAFVPTAEWGTVPYMAGEYLDNKLCKSSDVYSFGVLLWQMYTGKAPFDGHHEAQIAAGVMFGNLQLEWPAGMPPPLARLGQACCRHEPEQRPSFRELVVALAGLETQVRNARTASRAARALPEYPPAAAGRVHGSVLPSRTSEESGRESLPRYASAACVGDVRSTWCGSSACTTVDISLHGTRSGLNEAVVAAAAAAAAAALGAAGPGRSQHSTSARVSRSVHGRSAAAAAAASGSTGAAALLASDALGDAFAQHAPLSADSAAASHDGPPGVAVCVATPLELSLYMTCNLTGFSSSAGQSPSVSGPAYPVASRQATPRAVDAGPASATARPYRLWSSAGPAMEGAGSCGGADERQLPVSGRSAFSDTPAAGTWAEPGAASPSAFGCHLAAPAGSFASLAYAYAGSVAQTGAGIVAALRATPRTTLEGVPEDEPASGDGASGAGLHR